MRLLPQEKKQFESDPARTTLAKAFFELTRYWNLSRSEEAQLLGWMYEEKRTQLDNLRKGKSLPPLDRDKFERMLDLINIHKSLRLLFPYDRESVYQWVKIPRDRFGGHSALEVMLEDGKEGITAIRRYLDYERTR